jgi:hypothetical protein
VTVELAARRQISVADQIPSSRSANRTLELLLGQSVSLEQSLTRDRDYQHTLEKICERKTVRAAKPMECLKALEEYERDDPLIYTDNL